MSRWYPLPVDPDYFLGRPGLRVHAAFEPEAGIVGVHLAGTAGAAVGRRVEPGPRLQLPLLSEIPLWRCECTVRGSVKSGQRLLRRGLLGCPSPSVPGPRRPVSPAALGRTFPARSTLSRPLSEALADLASSLPPGAGRTLLPIPFPSPPHGPGVARGLD